MDGPTNAMVITAVMIFDDAPLFSDFMALVRERLIPHRRFRERVVEPPLGRPYWAHDRHFDVEAHVHRIALPAPGDQATLEALVGDLASTPLDRSKPLWQVHWVEGFGRGAALIARLHHAMGDGVALVRFLLGLADEGHVLAPPDVGVSVPEPHGVVEHAKVAAAQAATLARLLLIPSDDPNPLKGDLGTQKRAAWSPAIPLDDVKALARVVDGKANDVLLGALTGALATHLASRGPLPHAFRALTPVYVKRDDDGEALGNHFGLVYLDLPLDVTGPLERIREVKRRMDAIKAQPDAVVALGVLSAMGLATNELEHIGIELFTKKATVMITNAPGPPVPIHFAGKRLTDLMVWAPVSGHIGIGLSLVSYAGRVRLGIAADARLLPDPSELGRAFVAELERARRLASLTSCNEA
jgi:hypothetical protein